MTSIRLVKPDGTGDQLAIAGPKIEEFRWSPDGKWLAYSREDDIRIRDVWAAPMELNGAAMKAGKPVNITDHPGYNDRPRWFADCSKLAFRSNRYRNRDVETLNDQGRYGIYSVSLVKDKEKLDEDDDADPKPETKPETKDAKPGEKKEEKKPEVKLDPDEIERRSKVMLNPEAGVGTYEVSPDGKSTVLSTRSSTGGEIWVVATEGGSAQKVNVAPESASRFQWAPDSSRFYYLSGGQVKWLPKAGGSGGAVAFTARMEIDRLVDYRAAFDEAWQTINDRYYDKTFHGADWTAVGQKYRDLLGDVSVRQDFNYLITQMFGDLNSSHTGVFGGTASRPVRQTGYLGVRPDPDYDGPGIKVASVVHRSPADHDESRIKPGEYVLSVDGQDVRGDSSFEKAMADKVGRTVTLVVNATPDKNGARTIRIKPISSVAWHDLLYEEWIDQRRDIVSKASGGRIGYLHVTDMGDEARNRFERELFSIGQRTDAIVLDIRDNNGGDTHDSLLRILERNRKYFTMAPRTETPFPQPERAWTKPVVLLTNGGSLSDAECLTNGFKELRLGKVVGTPTMGWIIFTSGTALVDGTFIRIPYLGCFTMEGRDMENWGVPPDITVDNTPADAVSGRDPQLARAVEEALHEAKADR
jgi:tricorn protease